MEMEKLGRSWAQLQLHQGHGGGLRMDFGAVLLPQGVQALPGLPREWHSPTGMPGGIWGSVQLGWMILVAPFPLRLFCDFSPL